MDPCSEPSICVDVIKAIAKVEGTTGRDLDFTLHDHISTGALDDLYRSDRGEWELHFEVPDHKVTVHSDGKILIDEQLIQRDP